MSPIPYLHFHTAIPVTSPAADPWQLLESCVRHNTYRSFKWDLLLFTIGVGVGLCLCPVKNPAMTPTRPISLGLEEDGEVREEKVSWGLPGEGWKADDKDTALAGGGVDLDGHASGDKGGTR